MPFSIEYEERGVVITGEGTITFDEVQLANGALWQNPRWERCEYEIWDLSDVRASTITQDQGTTLAYLDRAAGLSSAKERRVAMVKSAHFDHIGVASYEESAKQANVPAKTFGTLSEARAWLGC